MRCGHVVVVVREVGIATLENCATSQELLDFRLLYQQLGSTSFSSCLVDWTDSSSDRTATTQQMRERARERRRHIQVESSRKSGRRRVKSGDSERRINNGRRRPLQLTAAQARATDRVAGVANKAAGPEQESRQGSVLGNEAHCCWATFVTLWCAREEVQREIIWIAGLTDALRQQSGRGGNCCKVADLVQIHDRAPPADHSEMREGEI